MPIIESAQKNSKLLGNQLVEGKTMVAKSPKTRVGKNIHSSRTK